MGLYSIGGFYKLELQGRIFYTGEVIYEDDTHIKLIDRDMVERQIKKEKIEQSMRIDQERMESHEKRIR